MITSSIMSGADVILTPVITNFSVSFTSNLFVVLFGVTVINEESILRYLFGTKE